MPFKSEKQKKLFYAAAHNPEIARKRGISQEVAEKYIRDSEGKVERFSKIKKKLKGKK
jgi:hypothetical protein